VEVFRRVSPNSPISRVVSHGGSLTRPADQGGVRRDLSKNSTDRGKPGTKKSRLVEGDGGPLGVVISRANVVDQQLVEATIEAIVVKRPDPAAVEQHLSLDKGYDNPTGHEVTEKVGYIGHIRPIGKDRGAKRLPGRRKARRWVVGADLGMAVEVPGDPGALRQALGELPGSDSTGVRPALVPATPQAQLLLTVLR
jgi:hypothetical protein